MVRKFGATSVRTQLTTGHGGFSEYLNGFGCKESPARISDPEVSESVQHLLFECPVHSKKRYDLEQQIGLEVKAPNMASMIASENRNRLLDYCEKTVKTAIKKNETQL